MGKYLLTPLFLASLSFAAEPFVEWWNKAKEVCIWGNFRDFSKKERELKPFCCVIHRVEVRDAPVFLKKRGIKESCVVVASCRGFLFGVINYDGGTYAVNGKTGISKSTPIGVIRILNERIAIFEICQGSVDFEKGCLSEIIGQGYIIKKN